MMIYFETSSWKSIIKTTTAEYSQASSIHGLQYIVENGKGLFASKIIWTLIVFFAAILGIIWSVQVFIFILLMLTIYTKKKY